MTKSNFSLTIDNKKAELSNDAEALSAIAGKAIENFLEQNPGDDNKLCIQYAINGVAEKREFIVVAYNIGINLTLEGCLRYTATLRPTPCPPDEENSVITLEWYQRPKGSNHATR